MVLDFHFVTLQIKKKRINVLVFIVNKQKICVKEISFQEDKVIKVSIFYSIIINLIKSKCYF